MIAWPIPPSVHAESTGWVVPVLCLVLMLVPTRNPLAQERVLTDVQTVRNLTPSEASQQRTVRLRATVTYFDAGNPLLFREHTDPGPLFFVQDETGGIFVEPAPVDETLSLRSGDRVVIRGVTSPGDFAPVIARADVERVGAGEPPDPATPYPGELFSGRFDSQWIRISGVPHRARVRDGVLTMRIASGLAEITVTVPGYDDVPSDLLDRRIRVTGVCGTIFNDRRQLDGVYVAVPGSAFLESLAPSPTPPFELPVRTIGAVRSFDPAAATNHRIRIRGAVTFAHPRTGLIIQDSTGGLRVEGAAAKDLPPGTQVDVAGFPEPGPGDHAVHNAVVRSLGRGDIPAPSELERPDSLRPFDHRNVTFAARLLDQTSVPEYELLTLRWGNRIVKAYLFRPLEQAERIASIRPGSRLRLEGVLNVPADTTDVEPSGQRADLLIRSGKSVQVLEAASWWTPRRAAIAVSAMVVLLLAAGVWLYTLRRRVRQQTAKIRSQMEQERALREEAEAGARAKEEFLAGMSHDLRSPLSNMIGFADLITDTSENNLVVEHARRIRSSGRELLELVDELITTARLGTDHMKLEPQAVDLSEKVREQMELYETHAHDKGLELRFELDDPVSVEADPKATTRIIRNLLSNALKFTREGGVTVRVGSNGKAGILEVEDTGRGIEPELREKIFEAFEQSDEPARPTSDGVGLGLSIVKHLCDRMDAEVELESEKGTGSLFRVRFRRA